jgi:hypothetical protein
VNATANGDAPQPAPVFNWPKINISEIKQIMIICPATIFANKRIINAKGLINTPNISTGTRISLIPNGTPGGLKMCDQKCLLLLNRITKNEITPNTTVNAILPVTLAEPGINPKMLFISIKKNTVSKYGIYFMYFSCPRFGFATSSLINMITVSMAF